MNRCAKCSIPIPLRRVGLCCACDPYPKCVSVPERTPARPRTSSLGGERNILARAEQELVKQNSEAFEMPDGVDFVFTSVRTPKARALKDANDATPFGDSFWTPDRDRRVRETQGKYRNVASLADDLRRPSQVVMARWHALRAGSCAS